MNISSHGFWLCWNDEEYFLDYAHYPWFKEASASKIARVESPAAGMLHWPDLDVDLSLSIIQHPERYPKVSKR